jgi:hypothetical protein
LIADRFVALGLKTEVFGNSPFQEFAIPDGFEVKPLASGEGAWLRFGQSDSAVLEVGVDWTPLAVGAAGSFDNGVVFAGYAISAADEGYDDFAGIDVAGKVVIALRKEPTDRNGRSRFGGQGPSRHAYFSTKQANVAFRNAAALIIVNDSATMAAQGGDRLLGVDGAGQPLGNKQVPTLQVLRSQIDPWIKQSCGRNLAELEKLISDSGKPVSQALSDLKISGGFEMGVRQAPVRNVVGILPGSGRLSDQYVIVGAHYDHVGLGGEGSLAPGTVAVHNGADDNGSGTVGLLEIAKQLSARTTADRRGIIFIAFAAEERGLLGSEFYVKHPPIPLGQCVAMINLDMIGRMGDGTLTVYGTGTALEFPTWLDRFAATYGLELTKEPAGFGPSDHQSFHEAGLPVFHFFTGLHNQYHRPTDDLELVDFPGLTRITGYVADLIDFIATHPNRPTPQVNHQQAQIGENPGSRRAKLGVTVSPGTTHCIVQSVVDGGVGMRAGLRPGDIIAAVDGKTVNDLPAILRNYRIGQEARLRVIRQGQSLEIIVVF